MDVTIVINQHEASIVIITLPEGRITSTTLSALRLEMARVIKFHKTNVLLNFNHVEFIDSMGMAIIFSAMRACRQYGAEAKLVALQQQPKMALLLAGVDEIMQLYDSQDQALSDFQPPRKS